MKYCTKCGAQMNDDALYCPKCGTKVNEVIEENKTSEEPINNESSNIASNQNTKQRKAIHEQKIIEFLPISLAIVVASIIVWIIDSTAQLTGIGHIMPLLIFIIFSGGYSAISMIRAIKTLNRKMYFNSILSFVLFALLVTCFFVNLVMLFSR